MTINDICLFDYLNGYFNITNNNRYNLLFCYIVFIINYILFNDTNICLFFISIVDYLFYGNVMLFFYYVSTLVLSNFDIFLYVWYSVIIFYYYRCFLNVIFFFYFNF